MSKLKVWNASNEGKSLMLVAEASAWVAQESDDVYMTNYCMLATINCVLRPFLFYEEDHFGNKRHEKTPFK